MTQSDCIHVCVPFLQSDKKPEGAEWNRFPELSNETPLVEVKFTTY
jgi:hypothetical protein